MTPSGWNYNLTKRCVKTTLPNEPNYYEDMQQCGFGFPGQTKSWAIAAHSGREVGVPCPPPNSQSFLINSGPVTLNWVPHTDEFGNNNWSVNMKTDFHNFAHPCGAQYFTWYMFMDHLAHGGGPLPNPDALRFSATVNYNDFCPAGGSRALAMFHGYWNGKQRMVEVQFQDTNWGDSQPGNPVIAMSDEDPTFQYLAIHGQYFGLRVPKAQDVVLTVPWHAVINTLISQGYLPAPEGEWATMAIGIGHETFNGTPSMAVVTNLWFTNFRIDQI